MTTLSLVGSYPCAINWAEEMPSLLREQLPANGQIMVEVKPQWVREGQVGVSG